MVLPRGARRRLRQDISAARSRRAAPAARHSRYGPRASVRKVSDGMATARRRSERRQPAEQGDRWRCRKRWQAQRRPVQSDGDDGEGIAPRRGLRQRMAVAKSGRRQHGRAIRPPPPSPAFRAPSSTSPRPGRSPSMTSAYFLFQVSSSPARPVLVERGVGQLLGQLVAHVVDLVDPLLAFAHLGAQRQDLVARRLRRLRRGRPSAFSAGLSRVSSILR